jgi:hypothetical protein
MKKPAGGFFAGIADGLLNSTTENINTLGWLDNSYKRTCFYIGFLEGLRRSTRHIITPEISDEMDDLMLRLSDWKRELEGRHD